jgi:flavodoxin
VIAATLHRELQADLFEITTARPYPEDYEAHVAQATAETKAGIAPALVARVEGIAAYGILYLGFPIWGMIAPPPLHSFLTAHDQRGKTIRPFITHGGYGIGDAPAVLASLARGARIEPPFVMKADQECGTLEQVRHWIGRGARPASPSDEQP